MKWIKRLILLVVLVVLLVAGLVALGLASIDGVIKTAVKEGGTRVMGVSTDLQKADVSWSGSSLALEGLSVGNPAGYQAPTFLTMGNAKVSVTPNSVNKQIVEIPELTLETINVNLERKEGKANYAVILENIKKFTDAIPGGGKDPKPDAGDSKKFIVRQLNIRNVTVSANMVGASGAIGEVLNTVTSVTVPIEKIELSDVGSPGAADAGVAKTGVSVSELLGIIVKAVLGAASEKGGDLLPAEFLADLKGKLADAGGLAGLTMQVIAKPKEEIKKLTDEVKEKTDKAIKDAAEGAKKQLEGFIPGLKKSDEKPDEKK
ncbi:MAG: AsmA family protein [Planctomycetota bacterium]|nr:AsmA family protein [Planctomycetota bacterium]